LKHKLFNSALSDKIIGCAIDVHRNLGPGFLEKFYEEALCLELERKQIIFERQVHVTMNYLGRFIGNHRLDLIVEGSVVIEIKAVKDFEKIHFATTLSYLKASRLPVALLLNFNTPTLSIKRFANSILRLNTETLNFGDTEKTIDFLRNEGRVP
jgi:GxxExxY protein